MTVTELEQLRAELARIREDLQDLARRVDRLRTGQPGRQDGPSW